MLLLRLIDRGGSAFRRICQDDRSREGGLESIVRMICSRSIGRLCVRGRYGKALLCRTVPGRVHGIQGNGSGYRGAVSGG